MVLGRLFKNSTILWVTLVVFLFFYFILAFPYFSGDVKNHVVWANSLLNQGTNGFYSRQFKDFAFPNYPPVAMGLFALSLKLYQLSVNLINWLNSIPFFPSKLVFIFQDEHMQIAFLKLLAIFSNLGLAAILFFLGRQVFKNAKPSINLAWLILLINPSLIYLSVIWGQFDLLPVLFLLLAFLLLFNKYALWSPVFMTISLLTKQTIIIFWPIYLYYLWRQYGTKQVIIDIIVTIVLFYLAYLPFQTFSLTFAPNLYLLNFDLVSHSVGENVFNLWGLLFNFKSISDSNTFLNISYQYWGYVLFFVALIPALILFIKRRLTKERLFLLLLYISLIDFFFLTRMHERYLAPAVVFSLVCAIFMKRMWIMVIILSLIYLLNLYHGLYQPSIGLFDYLVNSILLLKVIVIGLAVIIVYNFYLYAKQD